MKRQKLNEITVLASAALFTLALTPTIAAAQEGPNEVQSNGICISEVTAASLSAGIHTPSRPLFRTGQRGLGT